MGQDQSNNDQTISNEFPIVSYFFLLEYLQSSILFSKQDVTDLDTQFVKLVNNIFAVSFKAEKKFLMNEISLIEQSNKANDEGFTDIFKQYKDRLEKLINIERALQKKKIKTTKL